MITQLTGEALFSLRMIGDHNPGSQNNSISAVQTVPRYPEPLHCNKLLQMHNE